LSISWEKGRPMTQPPGGSGVSAVDGSALLAAGKTAQQVEAPVRSCASAFGRPTDQAAAALGHGWETAAAMTRLATQWHQAVSRLADEIDYLGSAVEKSARTHTWAEQEATRRVRQIRTGKR
jgi:hypothetical protein